MKTDTDNDGISDDKDNCPDTQADNIVDANGCAIIKGDMNRDGDVDIKDSQLGLKVITLQKPIVDPLIDADGDGKIGLKDTIYTIQRAQEKIEDPEE